MQKPSPRECCGNPGIYLLCAQGHKSLKGLPRATHCTDRAQTSGNVSPTVELCPPHPTFGTKVRARRDVVKIRPRKACRYPNLRSFVWVSYDKVGGLYSGKLGIRSEARASDLGSYPRLWWKRIKLHLYEGTKVSTLRGPAQLADLQGALCVPHL